MADIELYTIGSGYNLTPLNQNMVILEEVINNDVIHKNGGNNVMDQELDMDSNLIINLETDPDDLNCAANVGFVNDSVAGVAGISTLVDNVRGHTSSNVTEGAVVLTEEESLAPFHKIVNTGFLETVTITESAAMPTMFFVQVSGDHNVTLAMDTLGTTYTLVPNRVYAFAYKYGVSCVNLMEGLYNEVAALTINHTQCNWGGQNSFTSDTGYTPVKGEWASGPVAQNVVSTGSGITITEVLSGSNLDYCYFDDLDSTHAYKVEYVLEVSSYVVNDVIKYTLREFGGADTYNSPEFNVYCNINSGAGGVYPMTISQTITGGTSVLLYVDILGVGSYPKNAYTEIKSMSITDLGLAN